MPCRSERTGPETRTAGDAEPDESPPRREREHGRRRPRAPPPARSRAQLRPDRALAAGPPPPRGARKDVGAGAPTAARAAEAEERMEPWRRTAGEQARRRREAQLGGHPGDGRAQPRADSETARPGREDDSADQGRGAVAAGERSALLRPWLGLLKTSSGARGFIFSRGRELPSLSRTQSCLKKSYVASLIHKGLSNVIQAETLHCGVKDT